MCFIRLKFRCQHDCSVSDFQRQNLSPGLFQLLEVPLVLVPVFSKPAALVCIFLTTISPLVFFWSSLLLSSSLRALVMTVGPLDYGKFPILRSADQ